MQATDTTIEAAVESLLGPETTEEVSEETEATPEVEAEGEAEIEPVEALDEDEESDEDADADTAEAVTDEDEPDDAGSEDRFFVKVDGKEQSVTLEDLKRSFSGQSYIQKGMAEAAEARKQVEQHKQALQAEQQRFIQAVEQYKTNGLAPAPQRPDPKLAETDPIGFMQAQAKYQAESDAYQAQEQNLTAMRQQQIAQRQAQEQSFVAEQAKLLQEAIPEFADPEKGTALKTKLMKTGEAFGFSPDELANVKDARTVKVLHDAMRWRELQSGTEAAKKKPTSPKSVKPTAKRAEPQATERKRKMARAKKSGNINDFVDLLLVNQS